MTGQTEFDRAVAGWLETAGPTEMRSASVDAALESARGVPQRRGVRAFVAGTEAWPAGRRDVRIPHVPVRALVAAALILALIAAALVGVGAFREPRPVLGGGGWITVSLAGDAIHVLSSDGSVDRATPKRASNFCSHLSPTGDRIAYSVRFQGMFFERLDGTGRRGIAGFGNFGFMDGIWSPDRSRLAFRASNDSAQSLEVLSMLDDSVTTLLTTTTDNLVSEAAWSPDGQRLAFARASGGQGSIEIFGLDGVRVDSIGPLAMPDELNIAWSPNGSSLAYVTTNAAGSWTLAVIDLKTGVGHDVLTGDVHLNPGEQAWSPDGQWIALSESTGSVVIIRADGTHRTDVPVTRSDVQGWVPRWSPVDDVVAVADGASVLTVRADGTDRVVRPLGIGQDVWDFDWSPDGSRLVVADLGTASGELQVTTYDASGDAAPVLIATQRAVGNGPGSTAVPPVPICLSWDGPPANH